jgi:hypothetical protein
MNKIINIKRIWNGWYIDLEIDGKLLHIWTSIDPTNIAAIILSQFERGLLPDKCVICNENLMLFEITGKNTVDGETITELNRGGSQSTAESRFCYHRPVDMPWLCGGNRWEILTAKFMGYGPEPTSRATIVKKHRGPAKPANMNHHNCECGHGWYSTAIYKYCPHCFSEKIDIKKIA